MGLWTWVYLERFRKVCFEAEKLRKQWILSPDLSFWIWLLGNLVVELRLVIFLIKPMVNFNWKSFTITGTELTTRRATLPRSPMRARPGLMWRLPSRPTRQPGSKVRSWTCFSANFKPLLYIKPYLRLIKVVFVLIMITWLQYYSTR